MNEYEVLIETINPCGGEAHANKEFKEIEGETTVLELRVAPEDMGKLIGRQGRIAKEIRTIVKSVAQRNGQKVSVEIVD